MDIIFLNDLRVDTVIGIYEWERQMKQTVSIDLEMGTDVKPAAQSDDVKDAVNYKSVAKRVSSFVSESRFQLVESLAENIAAILVEEFGVPWVKVTVSKPGAVRGSRDVGVRIERTRAGSDA